MSTTTAAGATVHYATSGSGPGLVLVAGTGLDAQTNFGHLVPAFAEHRTVVLPDYVGSGETVEPAGPLSVEILAGQVAAVAEQAVEGPVDLVGYSLGAVVAAAVAATHTHLVRRLVLVAGWPDADDARHKLSIDLWQRLERTDHDLFTRFLQLSCLSAPFLSSIGDEGVAGLIAGAPPITEGMRRHLEVDAFADISDLAPKISCPTLVVGLTRDHVIPVEQVKRLHAEIPGSRYAEIDSGHLVVFERPVELVAAVQEFLFEDE